MATGTSAGVGSAPSRPQTGRRPGRTGSWPTLLADVRAEANAVDQAVLDGIADADTPRLDTFFAGLSRSADHSRLWLATARPRPAGRAS